MREKILAYLQQHPAPRLLWLGAPEAEPPELSSISPHHAAITRELSQQLGDEHYDCAVIEHMPAELDMAAAEALVARLRDVLAQRILWVTENGSPWERRELIALGFRLLDASDSGDRLYGYDIDNYKTTPDWLNARHWANPELWGKHRW